ncbi:MAG: hypothetical protein LCI00_31160 [Chloroflexi bacterium]|nr:hypothetical protein [Chloroflexota bacterium]MCC6893306.1 hypothetical protein [Anaerolineae bacterium]
MLQSTRTINETALIMAHFQPLCAIPFDELLSIHLPTTTLESEQKFLIGGL